MTGRAAAAFAIACAFGTWSTAFAQSAPLPAAQTASIDTLGTTALAALTAPGLSVTIVRDGKIAYARGFGLRDVAKGRPVDADTVFALGPVTKQFTAAAIEMLAVSGKVSVDATVATYLPKAPHGNEIRVRDLLRETSGLPDYLNRSDVTTIVTSKTVTPAMLLDSVAGMPLDFAPGSRYEQSGTNYVALGAIIEAVSAMPYARFILERIAVPFGLGSLTFGMPESADVTQAYDLIDYAKPIVPWSPQATYAADGLYASGPDLAKWDALFYGFKVVPEPIVADMVAPISLPSGASIFGLGSFTDPLDDRRQAWQHGGSPGGSALNSWLPDAKIGIVILANSLAFDPTELARSIVHALTSEGMAGAVEDPADAARARREYAAWQHGAVDPSHYAAAMQKLIASGAAADVTAKLKAAGDPTSFLFEGLTAVANGVAHRYRVITAGGIFDVTIAYGANGPIQQITFTLEP